MSDLDSFLSRGSDAEPEPEEKEPVEQAPEQPEPEEKPEPEKPDAEDDADLTLQEGDAAVPRRAYEDERRKRQDHKERAARLEGELAELRRQFEETRKAQQAAQQQPAPQEPPPYIPNPVQDPQGFIAWQQAEQTRAVIGARLDMSEMLVRKEYGDEAVKTAQDEFRAAMAQNPALQQQLYAHPHPYEFVMQHTKALRLQREIGTDPDAYEKAVEARIRERVLAEMGGQAAPAAPVIPNRPSIAGARSAAPRSAPTYTGDTPLSDILGKR